MYRNHACVYNVKFKVSSNGTLQTKHYKSNKYKDLHVYDDDEKCQKKGRIAVDNLDDRATIRQDSLSRSRNLVIDYACENEAIWKSFITLTFKNNVTDVSLANKTFANWRRQMTRFCKQNGFEFSYLCVPEFQKRGAVHYHMLTNLEVNSIYLPLQEDKENMYDVRYWRQGWSSAFDIIHDTDDKFNVALYITKYLYKDLDNRLLGYTRVLKSNNLKKPNEFYLLTNSDTYKRAMNFIKEKGYNITNIYSFEPTVDKSYITPFISLDYKSSIREDNNTLEEILQNEGLEF